MRAAAGLLTAVTLVLASAVSAGATSCVPTPAVVEAEFVHKHPDHPNSPRWEPAGWNADANPKSLGWIATGATRTVSPAVTCPSPGPVPPQDPSPAVAVPPVVADEVAPPVTEPVPVPAESVTAGDRPTSVTQLIPPSVVTAPPVVAPAPPAARVLATPTFAG